MDNIEAWLLEDIPSGEESQSEAEDEDENQDNLLRDYVVGEDGVLQHLDYLGLAQEVEDGNPILNLPNDDMHEDPPAQFDVNDENEERQGEVQEDDEGDNLPLAIRLYREEIKWYKTYHRSNQDYDFTEETGPQVETESPLEAFTALFPDDLIQMLVTETNLYATQKANGPIRNPTDQNEMTVFLGLNIMMGIKLLPSYRDYWSARPEIRDAFISKYMSVNRFGWLLTHLHTNDNSSMPNRGDDNYDKLFKIRPYLNKISQTYKTSYKPCRIQSIDESMIRFKGRSAIKQYMPDKPIRRGYKVWTRADANGYICQFQIYEGKRNNVTEKNLGHRVVTELTQDLTGKNYTVCNDNFFNSVQLMIDLQQRKVLAFGTTRWDRKNFPKEELPDGKTMAHGSSAFRSTKTGIVAVRWKDKKGINFLSNYHNPNTMTTVQRRQPDGSLKVVSCPTLVRDYNNQMGCVDKADQLKSTYEINRRSKKWWHRIFFHFLDTTVTNAHIIYTENMRGHGPSIKLKDFRINLSVALCGIPHQQERRSRSLLDETPNRYKMIVAQEIRYSEAKHMPERTTSKRCALCSTKVEPHRTKWSCSTCNVGLCLSEAKNCFSQYHTK